MNVFLFFKVTGLARMLCFEFDEELVEGLPRIMNDLYEQMTNKEKISPDLMTFECLLSILSYYGNSSLCLHYFKQLTNEYNLRPNVNIFNALISCYCNEISLFSNRDENVNDALYYEKQMDLMETNIDKVLQVYDNCKQLLIAPNIDTMKLLFHCMNARLILSQNKMENEEENMDYTPEYNQNLLNVLFNDDIANYDIDIDSELAYQIMHCWISLGYWMDSDLQPAMEIYNKLCEERKIISHWVDGDCISLVNIPKGMYEDCWEFYLLYVIQYEMDKLLNVDDLRIEIPKYIMDDKHIEGIQEEIEQLWDVDLAMGKIEDGCISFVLKQCKDIFIAVE